MTDVEVFELEQHVLSMSDADAAAALGPSISAAFEPGSTDAEILLMGFLMRRLAMP
jgi:hypothetical protein